MESNDGDVVYKTLKTYSNSLDNGYEMNGILLLSYPCLESYILSNFIKRFWKTKFSTSDEAKKALRSNRCSLNNITENSLLLAVENMNNTMKTYGINNYDPSAFSELNELIYNQEEDLYKSKKYYDALSLISIILIDLGIIVEKYM